MSYVIMAIQEEGSETRIGDWDENDRGFETKEAAYAMLDKAQENYVEYRQIWVEELKDAAYYAEQYAHSMSDWDEYDEAYLDDQEWYDEAYLDGQDW